MYFFQINVLTILLYCDIYIYAELHKHFTHDLTVKIIPTSWKAALLQLLLVPICIKVVTINALKIQNPGNPNSLQAVDLVFNKQMRFKDVLFYCSCIFMFNP